MSLAFIPQSRSGGPWGDWGGGGGGGGTRGYSGHPEFKKNKIKYI